MEARADSEVRKRGVRFAEGESADVYFGDGLSEAWTEAVNETGQMPGGSEEECELSIPECAGF